MSEAAHDFSQKSTVRVTAHPIWNFTCPECNWTHQVATVGAPAITQCPWCGSDELESKQAGAFAVLNCSVHGEVVCLISNENIRSEDFMDLFCPHC